MNQNLFQPIPFGNVTAVGGANREKIVCAANLNLFGEPVYKSDK